MRIQNTTPQVRVQYATPHVRIQNATPQVRVQYATPQVRVLSPTQFLFHAIYRLICVTEYVDKTFFCFYLPLVSWPLIGDLSLLFVRTSIASWHCGSDKILVKTLLLELSFVLVCTYC